MQSTDQADRVVSQIRKEHTASGLGIASAAYAVIVGLGVQEAVVGGYDRLFSASAHPSSSGAVLIVGGVALFLLVIRFLWVPRSLYAYAVVTKQNEVGSRFFWLMGVHFPIVILHAIGLFITCRAFYDISVANAVHSFPHAEALFVFSYGFVLLGNALWLLAISANDDPMPGAFWGLNNLVACLLAAAAWALHHFSGLASDTTLSLILLGIFIVNSLADLSFAAAYYVLFDAQIDDRGPLLDWTNDKVRRLLAPGRWAIRSWIKRFVRRRKARGKVVWRSVTFRRTPTPELQTGEAFDRYVLTLAPTLWLRTVRHFDRMFARDESVFEKLGASGIDRLVEWIATVRANPVGALAEAFRQQAFLADGDRRFQHPRAIRDPLGFARQLPTRVEVRKTWDRYADEVLTRQLNGMRTPAPKPAATSEAIKMQAQVGPLTQSDGHVSDWHIYEAWRDYNATVSPVQNAQLRKTTAREAWRSYITGGTSD